MIISKGTPIYDKDMNEYIVEERIGGGGFSAVFKVINKKSQPQWMALVHYEALEHF